MDHLASAAIGVAAGLVVQIVAIWMRWMLERSDREASRREDQREVLAVIRFEISTLVHRFDELERVVHAIPCHGHCQGGPGNGLSRVGLNI